MAVVERYYWQPTDVEGFVKLHREFHDKHLKKAGASDMTLCKIGQIGKFSSQKSGSKTSLQLISGMPILKQRKPRNLGLK